MRKCQTQNKHSRSAEKRWIFITLALIMDVQLTNSWKWRHFAFLENNFYLQLKMCNSKQKKATRHWEFVVFLKGNHATCSHPGLSHVLLFPFFPTSWSREAFRVWSLGTKASWLSPGLVTTHLGQHIQSPSIQPCPQTCAALKRWLQLKGTLTMWRSEHQ